MLVVCCAQAVWYDEGVKLKDTRSGFVIKDEFWKQCLPATESAQLASIREVTSAQACITSIAATKPDWFRGSVKWDDATGRTGECA